MRVLIATGGTGGHIYPALALADAMKEKDPQTEILFVGTAERMESTEIPKAGYAFEAIKAKGLNGSALAKVQAVMQLAQAYFACRKIVRQFRPDYAIGFGNYISAPVILAAHFAHVPTMLHEQNSYAGKANRFLAKYADQIVGCYPENLDQFPPQKTRILGNPRASVAARAQRDPNVVRQLGLDPAKPLVVVVMGSLGSESVNAVMVKALKQMAGKSYQVLYVTGRAAYEEVRAQYQGSPVYRRGQGHGQRRSGGGARGSDDGRGDHGFRSAGDHHSQPLRSQQPPGTQRESAAERGGSAHDRRKRLDRRGNNRKNRECCF